jgi:hypothetical protein
MSQLVSWNKGICGTKPKEHCPDPPRAGSWIWSRTHTSTSCKLCQEEGGRQAASQVLGASLVPTWGLGLPRGRCPHTRNPLKSMTQMVSEPTPDEGVTRSNCLWPHCCTSPMLYGRDIG